MKNKILKNDRIFLAGSNGMVGNAVRNELINSGYGNKENGGHLLTPSRDQLDLSNNNDVNMSSISSLQLYTHSPLSSVA